MILRAENVPSLVWRLLGCYFFCGWALGGSQPLHSLPPLSSQAQPESAPIWVPPEGVEAAWTFLYSGDAQQLSGANCSERYEAHGARTRPELPPVLQRAAATLAQAANFLNMLLQANDIRESSVEEDVEWYQALVRSVAEGDPRAYRALLTFSPPPGASHLQLALQATRIQEETILQDLSGSRVQEESPVGNLDTPDLQKRVLTNDLRSLGSPKWPRGDGYVGDIEHVSLSPPFLECQQGRLRPGWLITLSATFYGLKPDLSPEVRGQVQMDVDLQSVDINQCANGPGWYSNTHLCDLNSTQCVPLENQGFVLGRYLCRCLPGFYGASHSGGLEESATQPTGQFGSLQGSSGRLLRCQPCPEGCTSCMDATPCLAEKALALRAAVLTCQACCMLAVFLSMLVSYRCRESKRIRASGVILLETILFGSLLLYFPVFILYFKPSVFRCIALRWVRLLGFVIVYGTIILKLYRVLQLFLSRTAQRGPHLSSGRLLRRLGLLLLLVLGFLVVWTSGVLERDAQHMFLVTQGHTPTGRHFYLCHHDRWDYIMVVAEMLLLCWGSFLCYATRAVPSAFHEPRYMGIALHNELLLSSAFHTARFVLVPSLHPDWTLLLFFFHTHSTVTATLALLFIPKFWKSGAPPREEIVDEVYEDELDLQRSGSYLESSIASAWSERSLDPGDIRDELKKLYAQLEVHKTKEMTANNPHLPKKPRPGLGRSFIRYLAEFPEALVRQHSRDSGSPGRSSRSSLPGSSRRRLLSFSLQDPEGAQALHKPPSTHDHHKEQDLPLLDSMVRRKLAQRRAESRESRESVEGPPVLGFRSASAHNLTVGERLPRARPASLHKSLSVVAGSREKALLVASQAYLEESYRQAKEREERKKAEAAMASPGRRPSTRRLERAWGGPLSAPPSPAKSSSVDSSHTSRQLHEESGRQLPHPPIRHQVSTPILGLPGAWLGEPKMLSPTSTLTPALMPAPVLPPAPALVPVLIPPQSPSLLTYICPWENAELPVKKENVTQEGPSGTEQGNHLPGPARTRIWRALSVAIERKASGENEMDTEDRGLQGEAEDMDGDRPKIFSKSHSLKAPVQQGSVRSLGLAIKALTRSRSTYREKESGEEGPEKGRKDRAPGEGVGASPRSPRVGRPKAVSKQAALEPCDDEESLQNQQNAHTSKMLQVCHQEDRGKRTAQDLGEGKAEKAGKTGLTTLRQGRQNTTGDKSAEQVKEDPGGGREQPKAGLQSLGTAPHKVAEVCPWELAKAEMCPPASGNKVEICPWEMSEGSLEMGALKQNLKDSSQEEKGKVPEKPGPKDVVASAQKKPERLFRGQEAVCSWEGVDPEVLSPQPATQGTDRSKGRFEAAGSGEARDVVMCQFKVTDPEADKADKAEVELCPWEVCEGENKKPAQEVVKALPQEKQKTPKKATIWKEQKLEWESLCPWESTDFRGPSAVSTQVSETPEYVGSLGSGVTEVCPWEAGDTLATRKAELCSRELDTEKMGKGRESEGTNRESLQEKRKDSRNGSSGELEEHAVQRVQKLSNQQESVHSWEDIGPGHSSSSVDGVSSTAEGQFLSAGGNRVLQACTREDSKPEVKEARPAKAEICPWEANERAEDWTLGQAPKEGKPQKNQEKMPAQPGIKAADVTACKEHEGQIPGQEALCPRKSMDPGSDPSQPCSRDTGKPKDSVQILDSVGGKTADICPWEVDEALTAKANICPWEVSASMMQEGTLGTEAIWKFPNDTEKVSGDSGPRKRAATTPEKPEQQLPQKSEVVCPWEGLDPEGASQQSHALDTSASKAGPQDLGSVGCRPAEVCPWEVEEVPTTNKAEVCPWEVDEGLTEKGREQEMENESTGQRKTLAKLPSLRKDVSKWEAKSSQEQETVCPWETMDLSSKVGEGHASKVSDDKVEKGGLRQHPNDSLLEHMGTPEKAACSKAEHEGKNISKELQSVCPWEGLAPGGLFSHPDKPNAGSWGQVSVEGRVAEVCPWDALDPDACNAKAQICPWEEIEQIPEKGVSRQDGKEVSQDKRKAIDKSEPKDVAVQKKQEKADGKQEAVCPWESQDCEGLSLQLAPQASDRGKGSSEAAGGVGARIADVCPWDAEEVPSVKKVEICPWEMSEGAAEKGGLKQKAQGDSQEQGEKFLQKAGSERSKEHFSVQGEKLSGDMETVCPWEGTGSGGLCLQPDALDTEHPKLSSQGAHSQGSSVELCRWEVTDPEGNKIKGTMAEICPWEGTGTISDKCSLLALTATQTEIFTTTAQERPPCLSVHRPLESFLPQSKSPHPEVSRLDGTSTLTGARESQGPLGLRPGTTLAPEPSVQEAATQKSSSLTEEQKETVSKTQSGDFTLPNVYPWDWE
ncbi:PREDICTED: probable G-protein coupled receptor 179 [Elephantulus edwardii]|uniref:probable G-protein coupled receptor 179 n=1 Tax=Elephantulus edwardii TaxID=28737 RepID=UPI0003F06B25|nr:PREDICTED: probable G-protein coupled receptor 179 [Elephantulus edwardii]